MAAPPSGPPGDQGPTLDIKVVHEPTVYLLGRQTVDEAELDRFLADHGVSWQTDTVVAAEHLCETAGRVCYMSFARPRPGGNSMTPLRKRQRYLPVRTAAPRPRLRRPCRPPA